MSESAPEVEVEKTLGYRVVLTLVRGLTSLWVRRTVRGLENLPQTGPALLVANHQSYLDIPLIAASAHRRHVAFVARKSLARSRFLDWLMGTCRAVRVEPGSSDRGALREMLAHLELGDLVAIFPEGTRTRDGRLGPFKKGASLAARKARVPLVPVAIDGSFDCAPPGAWFPRPRRVTVTFCAPLDAQDPGALERAREAIAEQLSG